MSTPAENFPLYLAFPAHLRPAFETYASTRLGGDSLQCRSGQTVTVGGEALVLPDRLYLDRRELVDSLGDSDLSQHDRDLVFALGSRHHDGYFRESCVRKLMRVAEAWVLPYVLAPLGEYVVEIGEVVLAGWERLDGEALAAFARDNPGFIARTRRRATSYWDCYYRTQFPQRDDYPPWQALCRLPT